MAKNISIEDWKNLSLTGLLDKYGLTLEEMYKVALENKLYKYDTPNKRRAWSDEDKEFLLNNKNNLTVNEAGRILHKSYNATLMYVKFIGAYEMIN